MLEMRKNCECCDTKLAADCDEARICSFECTFCVSCAEEKLDNICPNCDGDLVKRPKRAQKHLIKYPPSEKHILKPEGC